MPSANLYDLHGHGSRIVYYPEGRGPIPVGDGPGPLLIYDNGSAQVECRGDKLKVGQQTWAGTIVTALIRDTGIVPGAVVIPDVIPPPTDGSVPVHSIAVLANHRGSPALGPGPLETYSEFAVTGIAALIRLPA
jgi:hypothetical protein